ncbi:helix-turn-helix domain-containing protein [Xylanimonas cellulosilytica]
MAGPRPTNSASFRLYDVSCRHNGRIRGVGSSYTDGANMAGYRIDRQIASFGEHVRGWRMVLGLTAQQVAERAGITRDTLRKIETGDPGVSFRSVAQVLRALGVLDQTVEAIDPLNSDIGRLRAGNLTKKRAR